VKEIERGWKKNKNKIRKKKKNFHFLCRFDSRNEKYMKKKHRKSIILKKLSPCLRNLVETETEKKEEERKEREEREEKKEKKKKEKNREKKREMQ
jgi:hypothetical protein